MSCRDVGLEPDEVSAAMEAVGLRYPIHPTQTLVWFRPDSIFDPVAISDDGKVTQTINADLPVIVQGHRPGRNGSQIEDVRLGVVDGKTGQLMVSTSSGFVVKRFAFWTTPPAFEGEPPFFAEAKAEGWL